jgi:hypothetical protein
LRIALLINLDDKTARKERYRFAVSAQLAKKPSRIGRASWSHFAQRSKQIFG